MTTVTESVGTGVDDAYSYGTTLIEYLTYLRNGRYSSQDLTIGAIFRTVDVPQGTSVVSATFSLVQVSLTGSPDLRVYGGDYDDVTFDFDFYGSPTLPHDIVQTTANVAFDPSGTSNGDVHDIDVSGPIDEILARGGWTADNDLVLAIFNEGGTNNQYIDFAAIEHSTYDEPQLEIEYSAGVDIAVPLDTFTMTDNDPSVETGVNVDVPLDTFTMTDNDPSVETVVNVDVPLDIITMTYYTHAVAGGASVDVPLDTFTMTDYDPTVESGANIDVPLDTMTMTDHTPAINAGVNIDVPLDTLSMTDRAPIVNGQGGGEVVIVNHMHVRNGTGLSI